MMKNKKVSFLKRALIFILIAISTTAFTMFLGCDCGSEEEIEKTPSITLNQTLVNTFTYKEFKLVATTENTEESVSWTSSDKTIANVDGTGKVTPLNVGTANIIASVGEISAQCTVKVEATTQVPVIRIKNVVGSNISLFTDGTFTPDFELVFDGQALEDATFDMTVLDTSIATANSQTITCVSNGQTQISVTAKLFDKVLSDTTTVINLTVEPKMVVDVDRTVSVYAVQEFLGEHFINQKQIELSIDEQAVESSALQFSSADTGVATVSANGTVTGVKAGKTQITVKYNGMEFYVDVEIKHAVVERSIAPVEVETKGELPVTQIFGQETTVTKVYDVTDSDDIDGLTPIDFDSVKNFGNRTLMFFDDSTAVKVPVKLYSYIINDATELKNVLPSVTDGYIILANDITNVGEYPASGTVTFKGTLDGQGHTISGYTLSANQRGLFWRLENATIKDLIIDGVSATKDQCGTLAFGIYGGASTISNVTIKNVTLGTASHTFYGAMFGQVMNGSVSIKNCIVSAPSITPALCGALAGRHGAGEISIENSFFISDADLISGFTKDNDLSSTTNALKPQILTLNTLNRSASSSEDFTTPLTDVEGNIKRVLLNGTDVAYSVEGTNLNIVASAFSGLAATEHSLLICTSSAVYNVKLIVAHIITTAEQLKTLPTLSGYVMLGANIENVGDMFTSAPSNTFTGIFDGQGYTISNIAMNKSAGLFGHTVDGATIKNVTIKNLSLTSDQAGVFGNRAKGTINIENVFISVTNLGSSISNFAGGLFSNVGRSYRTTLNVTNSMIYMPTQNNKVGVMVGSPSDGISNTTVNLTNTFAISPNTIVSTGNLHGSNTGYKNVADIINAANASVIYASATAMQSAVDASTITLTSGQQTFFNYVKTLE